MSRGARRVLRVAALLCLLAGAVLLLRPVVNRYLYALEAEQVIRDFTERTASAESAVSAAGAGDAGTDAEAAPEPASETEESEVDDRWEELYRQIVQYNRNLFETRQSGLVDAFSYEQVGFSLRDFGFDEEMIGYLSIPALDVELPIYLGASRENLNRGAAHLTETSLPVGGENTNAVIAAHRGYSGIPMFRNIHLLEPGDEVYIVNFRETLTYQVVETKIIAPDDIGEILIQEDRDLVTLISCNPLGQNYQRYVVYCERVPGEN